MGKRTKLTVFLSIIIIPPMVVLVLMGWRIRTRISGHVVASQIQFVVGDASPNQGVPVLNSTTLNSLAVERFSSIHFIPSTFSVGDPQQYSLDEDRYPASAWKNLEIAGSEVAFKGDSQDAEPRITLENSSDKAGNFGRLDDIRLPQGSRITIETKGEGKLNIYLEAAGHSFSTSVVPDGDVQIVAEHSRVEGIPKPPYTRQSLTYRARLSTVRYPIEVVSENGSLLMMPTYTTNMTSNPFVQNPISVTALDFTHRDGSTGEVLSSLTKDGEVLFPDYSGKGKIALGSSDYILLSKLEDFSIRALVYKPAENEISVEFGGSAGEIKSGSSQSIRDFRLTAFDYFRYSTFWITLIVGITWLGGCLLALYKLYEEFWTGPPAAKA